MALQSELPVSVVIVNWNRKELLNASLRSVANQTEIRFETIVVDNGSTDGSVELLRGIAISQPELRLRIIENKTNHGFCAANNQGIAAARGAFVALLNNDAEARPGWLSSLYQALQEYPQAGMAASKILVHEDPSRIDKAGHLIYPDGQNRGRGSGEIDRGQFDRLEEVLWPDGCAAMYRTAMLAEIGGFDEDLFAYGDDAELGLRARIAGWRCVYVPKAVVLHHRGSTLGLLSPLRLELIERNRILLAVRHFPASLLWQNAWFYSVRLIAGGIAAMRGRGEAGRFVGVRGKLLIVRSLLAAHLGALAMIPRTLRKRHQARGLRKLTSREVRQLLLQNRISLKAITEQAI